MTNKKKRLENKQSNELASQELDSIGAQPNTTTTTTSEGTTTCGGQDPCKWWLRTRIHVALLGMAIGAVNCYAQATFCIAIVEMVLPADYVLKVDAHLMNRTSGPVDLFASNRPEDQSCPIEFKYRDYYDAWRFPENQSNIGAGPLAGQEDSRWPSSAPRQTIDVSNRFDWDASQQGLLLGAFAIGTAPLQVFGGRLAETYGAKWVLFAGCIGTAITNLSIPMIARFSFVLLLINRILMGIAQAGMEPGLMCLLAEWLTPNETGFFISMLLFAICTGFFLGSICSTFILTLNYGWPLAYYVSGGLNLFVGLVWIIYADSWPRFSKYISLDELNFIQHQQANKKTNKQANDLTETNIEPTTNPNTSRKNNISTTSDYEDDTVFKRNNKSPLEATFEPSHIDCAPGKQPEPLDDSASSSLPKAAISSQAPWRNILTTRSVWAFIICKFSVRWCADVMGNMLPLYFADVLHLSIKLNGTLNSISTALFAIFSFVAGWLVNDLIAKQTPATIEKTTLRKIFQSIASFGSALSVFLMSRYDCDIVFSMSMLLVVSCLLVAGTGGELQIPYDMTSKYPGTLHGMACTLSVSGWLAPPLIGLILGDQRGSRHRWSMVWYLTAAINLIGGLVFVLFADASPRDFDKPASLKNKRDLKKDFSHTDHTGDDELEKGYYNEACKPLDNSPPPQTKRLACQQNQLTLSIPDTNLIDNNQDSFYFDTKLLKIRQREESFLRLASFYPANLDSPLANCGSNLFPYREDTTTTTTKKKPVISNVDAQKDRQKLQQQHMQFGLYKRNNNKRGLIELLSGIKKACRRRPAEEQNKANGRVTTKPNETILPTEAEALSGIGGRRMEVAKEESKTEATENDEGWAPSVQSLRADVERQSEQSRATLLFDPMHDNQLLSASVDQFTLPIGNSKDSKEAPPMEFQLKPKTITHL